MTLTHAKIDHRPVGFASGKNSLKMYQCPHINLNTLFSVIEDSSACEVSSLLRVLIVALAFLYSLGIFIDLEFHFHVYNFYILIRSDLLCITVDLCKN